MLCKLNRILYLTSPLCRNVFESNSRNVPGIRMFLHIPPPISLRKLHAHNTTTPHPRLRTCWLQRACALKMKALHFVVPTVTALWAHTSKFPFHTFNYLLHGTAVPVFKGWYLLSWSRNSLLLWNREIHCRVYRKKVRSTRVVPFPLRELNKVRLKDKLSG
jgi:hypothetical protein